MFAISHTELIMYSNEAVLRITF